MTQGRFLAYSNIPWLWIEPAAFRDSECQGHERAGFASNPVYLCRREVLSKVLVRLFGPLIY